jgi:hypothetical protein
MIFLGNFLILNHLTSLHLSFSQTLGVPFHIEQEKEKL